MTAAALPLAGAPCPECRGGGELNGVECRGCGGRGRVGARPRLAGSWRGVLRRWADAAAEPAGAVVGKLMRWSATVPGIGGAAAFTFGVAGIAHAIWHWLPMVYPAAAIVGVFGLLADRRL